MSGLNQGHTWANIFHLLYTGAAPTNVQLNGLCSNIANLWGTALARDVMTTTTLTQVIAQDLTNPSAATGIASSVKTGSSTATGTLPVNVALCITWKTAERWRGGHPRMYMSGLGQSLITNGNSWQGTFQTQVQADANTFHTGLNALTDGGDTWQHVCLRRQQTLVDGTHVAINPPRPVPILSGIVDARVDSQRRRLGPDVTA